MKGNSDGGSKQGCNGRASLNKKPPTEMVMTAKVLYDIKRTIGDRKAESGGVAGGPADGSILTHWIFDSGSKNSSSSYAPDYETLNSRFRNDWKPKSIRMKGIFHSHPPSLAVLSQADLIYARQTLEHIDDLDFLFLPIVHTIPDTGALSIYAYVALLDSRGQVRVSPVSIVVTKTKFAASLSTAERAMLNGFKFDFPFDALHLAAPCQYRPARFPIEARRPCRAAAAAPEPDGHNPERTEDSPCQYSAQKP